MSSSTLTGQVYSLWNTYSSHWFSGYLAVSKPMGDHIVEGALQRLQDPSAYLDLRTLTLILALFRNEYSFFHYFIGLAHTYVQELSPERVEELVRGKKVPLALPLVIGPLHFLGVPHLVTFYVTESQFCFYDSKGRRIEEFPWREGTTLRDFALLVLNCLGSSPAGCELKQNGHQQQQDVNNCGLFVIRYLYQRVALCLSHEEVCRQNVSWEEVCAFRVFLAEKLRDATIKACAPS